MYIGAREKEPSYHLHLTLHEESKHTVFTQIHPCILSPAFIFLPQHPLQPPAPLPGCTEFPPLPEGREGCRAQPRLGDHPSLPASLLPAASPSAAPPAPGETDVFIKKSCSLSNIYKQNLLLTNFTVK